MLSWLILCLLACSDEGRSYKNEELCRDFCNLNQKKNFDILFDVSTINSRFRDGIPVEIAVYCPKVDGYFITIPIKSEDINIRKLYGSDKFYECKNSGTEDSKFLKKYINDFKIEYESIIVPAYYRYEKPKIDVLPNLGRYISFILTPTCTVYYIENLQELSPLLIEKIGKSQRFDDNWYYELGR